MLVREMKNEMGKELQKYCSEAADSTLGTQFNIKLTNLLFDTANENRDITCAEWFEKLGRPQELFANHKYASVINKMFSAWVEQQDTYDLLISWLAWSKGKTLCVEDMFKYFLNNFFCDKYKTMLVKYAVLCQMNELEEISKEKLMAELDVVSKLILDNKMTLEGRYLF